MFRTTIAVISLFLLGFTGCASPGGSYHSSYPTVSTSGESRGAATRYRSTSTAPSPRKRARWHRSGAVIPPPAPGAPSTSERYRPRPTRRIVVRRPVHRPGLGTVYGERITSRVNFTSFRRARTKPDGVVSIHYNDRQGLRAMTRHLRRLCCSTIKPYRVRAGITVQLVNQHKRPLSGLQIAGRTIVLGKAGFRYGILVRNLTARRYEIVVSVDGLDVIDGKRASLQKRGYIVPAYGQVYIRGYRTTTSSVAAFRFGSVRNSYAARTGSARNVGVVGIAAYSEYRAPVYYQTEVTRRLNARPFSNNGYAQPPR